MKKKTLRIILLITYIFLITACTSPNLKMFKRNDKLPIAGMGWTREADDGEVLVFSEDGKFTYHCMCGNPVGNSDACDTYTYNKKTKEITLNCQGFVDDETIKLVSYDEKKLVLEFENGTKEFDRIAEE